MTIKKQHIPLALTLIIVLLLGLLSLRSSPVRAAGLVVDVDVDDSLAHDVVPGDGTCIDQSGRGCTLRAAIEEANALSGADTITFDQPMDIILDTTVGALPPITETLTIDASSVWDNGNNSPGVSIDGVDHNMFALELAAPYCQVYGLYLFNFYTAVFIGTDHNTIGDNTQGGRNVIADNAGPGISIKGNGAFDNRVRANWIGLSVTGDTKQPNLTGIVVYDGAHDNTIGGTQSPDEGNYISGNTDYGIALHDSSVDGNIIDGNIIGLPVVGNQDVGNGKEGIYFGIGPQNNKVGANQGNTIASNYYGVYLSQADQNWIQFNTIYGNKDAGVVIFSANTQVIGNTIYDNQETGVYVQGASATGNLIAANSIYRHDLSGISLLDGGNMELPPPTIASAVPNFVQGTACAGCMVHIYSDDADEGEIYHAAVTADITGNWTYTGTVSGPNITATNTDGANNTSEFSAPKALSAANNPPNTPANPSPADGASGVSLTPTLSWTGGDPDPGDTVTYTVKTGFSSPPVEPFCVTTTVSCTVSQGTNLVPNTLYYWQVFAQDEHGATADSPIWQFTTGGAANNPPNTPASPSPTDGASGVSLTPALSWTGGDPDPGDTVTATVMLSTQNPPGTLACTTTSTSCTPNLTLDANTTYYWQVFAQDDQGAASPGPVWRFTTAASPPPPTHKLYLPVLHR